MTRREKPRLTHVQRDGDDVQGHGGVGDAAERRRLNRDRKE